MFDGLLATVSDKNNTRLRSKGQEVLYVRIFSINIANIHVSKNHLPKFDSA